MESLLVDGLAAHRLTRLIVTDAVADRPRARLLQALHEGGYEKAIEGLRCEWCTGVWVAAAVAAVRVVVPSVWRPVARALAVAEVVGLLSTVVSPPL